MVLDCPGMLLFLFLLLPLPALAVTTSPQAFRLEYGKSGSLLLGAEHAELEHAEHKKTVTLLWGNLDVFGEVDDVIVLSGRVVFHDGSKLNHALTVMQGSFESEPGSDVASEKVMVQAPGPWWRMLLSFGATWRDNIGWVAKVCASLVSAVVLWLLGWGLFSLAPKLAQFTAGTMIPEWPRNLLLGVLGSFGACVVPVMLFISVIGILLLPFYVIFLLLAGLVSYLAAALWAGHRLLPPKPGRALNPLGFLLGCLAFQFFWAVPVWWSLIPLMVLWTLAWGALLRSIKKLWA
jgi:hypothetical protein